MNENYVTLVPDSTIDIDNTSDGETNSKEGGSRKPGNQLVESGKVSNMEVDPSETCRSTVTSISTTTYDM